MSRPGPPGRGGGGRGEEGGEGCHVLDHLGEEEGGKERRGETDGRDKETKKYRHVSTKHTTYRCTSYCAVIMYTYMYVYMYSRCQ